MKDEWRETFQAYSRLPEHVAEVEQAIDTISTALDKRCYVSYSGGKDSTVLLHLVLQQAPTILVAHWDYGPGFMPREIENEIVQNAVAMGATNLEIYTSEQYEAGRPDWAVFAPEFIGRVVPRLKARGYRRAFVGLRAEESCKRKRRIKRHETIVMDECWPLASWTWLDVWAYIVANNLPYLSHYDKVAELQGSYRNVRLCTLFDPQFAHLGSLDNFVYWQHRNAVTESGRIDDS